MNNTSKILNQLNQVITIIPTQYVDALLMLHKKFEGKKIRWAVGGDLAESLRVVKVEPDCIDILTSKKDAEKIFQIVQEFKPEQISSKSWQLPRNAIINDKEYPVYVRSHYFDFSINSIKIKVQGDLQYKVNDWDWGDKLEFEPEYVYVVGKKIAVMPLSVKYDLYLHLGWVDRAEKISAVISNPRIAHRFR